MEKNIEKYIIKDIDCTSYYPSIILNLKLYPEIIGREFLTVYRNLFNERIEAKISGDKVKSDILKICLNGSFGKFGNKYSYLFSPNLLIQTTMTGQLALLMLIEQLEIENIRVVSANTDGIVIYCKKDDEEKVENIILAWEMNTGFETEETRYSVLCSRDVNNFIAVKEKGGIKLKGAYAPPEPVGSSWPNPHCQICVNAVIAYLTKNTPLRKTIENCRDIKQFVSARTVKGGAVKFDDFLGRVARWYYGLFAFGTINYKINGYTVSKTEGAEPCMTLPDEFPDDICYDWYVAEAEKILEETGCVKVTSSPTSLKKSKRKAAKSANSNTSGEGERLTA